MPPHPVPGVPDRLPERLSICLWIWGWITSALPEEPYGDLRQAMAGLVERGFNALRIETGLNWCFRGDGRPRGPLAFGPWIAGYSDNLRGVNARGGACHDVLARLIHLLELAREHQVWVILSSWEYQDSTWFVADPQVRAQVYAIPEEQRLMHLARHHDRLLARLGDLGLDGQIAFVEIHNEVDFSEFPKGERGKDLHCEAIAFLRDRHPHLLVVGDFGTHDPAIVPDNTQVYDQHMYAGAPFYLEEVYNQTVWHPEFDPTDPGKLASLRFLLRQDPVPWERFMGPARNIRDFWRPITWLYHNLDNARFDRWLLERLPAWDSRLRQDAEQGFAADAAEAARRHLPAVVDEGGFFYPPLGSRFEESEAGLGYLEFLTDLAIRHGYWGYMPTTYCGPDQPLWHQHPGWLRQINRRFQHPDRQDRSALHKKPIQQDLLR